MKKIYILVSALSFGLIANAQKPITTANALYSVATTETVSHPGNVSSGNHAAAVWSNSFETPADWVIDGPVGLVDVDHTWAISNASGTNIGTWFFATTRINSTLGGNYAVFKNGNPSSGSPPPVDGEFTITTVNSIDLSATPYAYLEFEQFGAEFQDLQSVKVSTDGTTFVSIGNNNDIPPLTSGGGSAYPNPMLRSYNITSAISANPSTVWIQFSWQNDVQNITYGWFVDDVAIYSLPNNDLVLDSARFYVGPQWVQDYTQIPTTQVSDVTFDAVYTNNGVVDQPNAKVALSNSATASSTPATLVSQTTATVPISPAFTLPGTIGNYTFDYTASSDSTEEVPADNSMTRSVDVTQFTFARDDGIMNGGINNIVGNTGASFSIGHVYELMADQTAYGISIGIGTGTTNNGFPVYGEVWVYDTGISDWSFVGNTADHIITNPEIGSVVTLLLQSPAPLLAGDLVAVVGAHYGDDVYIGTAQRVEDGTVIGFAASVTGMFSLSAPEAPMVRLLFDPTIGINEISENGASLSQNLPNPSNSSTTVNYELALANQADFEIVDIMGKVVYNEDLGVVSAGSHTIEINTADLAAGVYYYSLTVVGSKLTKKMIVTK